MCSKPKLNSSEDFRKGLEQHLRANMVQKYEQIPKVGRKKWYTVLIEEIGHFIRRVF
jgi:hypothetical protein